MNAERSGPLAGVRIVEFAGIGPGPFCCMLLADLGADVIRIDRPHGGDGGLRLSRGDRVVTRGRPSVAVDLKRAEGNALVRFLIGRADGLVEGFRPGVMERLGLGPADCAELNERLVYGRMTGWGQQGPLTYSPGHDLNYIAITGALAAIGREAEERPVIPLNLIGDYGGGGLLLAFGVVSALLEAGRSGRGQVIDAAMFHGAALLMTAAYGMHGAGDWALERGHNVLDGGAPFYDVYRCADGQDIAIGCLEGKFYATLLDLLDLTGRGFDDQWNRESWSLVREVLTTTFAQHGRAHWEELFAGTEVCFAPVLTMAEAPGHPHNSAAGIFVEVDGIVQPAPAPRFSRTPPGMPGTERKRPRSACAALCAWGVSEADVIELTVAGVIDEAVDAGPPS